MSEREPLRPQTLALDELVRQAVADVKASSGTQAGDTMLFLGNPHQAYPTLVITDPVLEPVDKLVWMVIMLQVQEPATRTVFPSYGTIGHMANIASSSTIARALAILRITRWLTLCARVRRDSGRFCSNLYALHDEPLPLADAFHLDTDYLAFLDSATAHGHARVRAVAKGLQDSMDTDIRAGQAVGAHEHPIGRRLEHRADADSEKPRRFFGFTKEAVAGLQDASSGDPESRTGHDRSPDPDRVRNSKTGSSSCYIYKTTTTTPPGASKFEVTGKDGGTLVYPRRLLGEQLEVANRYLQTLASGDRQPVLDELEGRFQAEAQGMPPLYDELRFLHALCRAVKRGQFEANLGIKVRSQRQAREQHARDQVRKDAGAPGEGDVPDEHSRQFARENLAKMREVLGSRGRAQAPDEED